MKNDEKKRDWMIFFRIFFLLNFYYGTLLHIWIKSVAIVEEAKVGWDVRKT